MPVNARIVLDFDEPLSIISVHRGLQVEADGVPLAGSIALSDGNRRVTFTSDGALAVDTEHTVTVTSDVTDLAGNPLANPGSFDFTTGTAGDLTAPRVSATDPADGTRGVATDTRITVFFDQPIDPLTVTSSTLFVQTGSQLQVAGLVTVAPDFRSATLVPDSPLMSQTEYELVVSSGVEDLAGNALVNAGILARFLTSAVADTTPPRVEAVSPQDGTAEVPVNARVALRMDEPLSLASIGSDAVTLGAGGSPVAGEVTAVASWLPELHRAALPTADLVARCAAEAGREIELTARLCDGAFEALMSGNAARHDEVVLAALEELSAQVDVIALAQASMARVVSTLPVDRRRVPILASPPLAIERLARLIEQGEV